MSLSRGRPVGSPKPPGSGRKPGTPNKSTQLVQELCRRLSCDPFTVLCHFANGDRKALGLRSIPAELRLRAATELAGYCAPKLAAVRVEAEVTATVEHRAVLEVPARLSPSQWERASQLSQSPPQESLPAAIDGMESTRTPSG